jgi:indolepyruvate ferredoxin oxidoreductase beta subunit
VKLDRPIRIAIAAMGGQGGGVLADWIVDLAEQADYHAQSTSVPGVAQRTGATVYYLELFPRHAGPGRPPVMALIPVPGDVDIVVAGELVEAGRAVLRGLVTPGRTTLIASTHRDYALSEKMDMADGRTGTDRLLDGIRAAAGRCICFDMASVAEAAGSVISAALFGAVCASESLPFTRAQFEDTIRRGGVGVDASLRAFAAAHDRARSPDAVDAPSPAAAISPSATDDAASRLVQESAARYPQAVREVLQHALPRLAGYQDLAYAREYLELLAPVAAADRRGDALLSAETARHLALWMTYEDTIRVAQAKIRPERIERIRAEANAAPGQVVHVVEFLHPRVEEICDTLPAPVGRWLLGSSVLRRALGYFCSHGRRIRTTALPGFLLLYLVALLRPTRRMTLRHRREMGFIRQWLERIAAAAPSDYELAVEIARCQQLIKGYGDTHARGQANYKRIMECLPVIRASAGPAGLLLRLRTAALADEDGVALQTVLQEIGAPSGAAPA